MNKLKNYLSVDITNIIINYLTISKYQVNRNKKLINFHIKDIEFSYNNFKIIKRHIKIWTYSYCTFCDNFNKYLKHHITNYVDTLFRVYGRDVKYIFNNSYPCDKCYYVCVYKYKFLQTLKTQKNFMKEFNR